MNSARLFSPAVSSLKCISNGLEEDHDDEFETVSTPLLSCIRMEHVIKKIRTDLFLELGKTDKRGIRKVTAI